MGHDSHDELVSDVWVKAWQHVTCALGDTLCRNEPAACRLLMYVVDLHCHSLSQVHDTIQCPR